MMILLDHLKECSYQCQNQAAKITDSIYAHKEQDNNNNSNVSLYMIVVVAMKIYFIVPGITGQGLDGRPPSRPVSSEVICI